MLPESPGFWSLAISSAVVRTALPIALIVGTILGLINYGDKILIGDISTRDMIKISVTYLVPYSVSTYSSVKALRSRQ